MVMIIVMKCKFSETEEIDKKIKTIASAIAGF